MWLSMPSLSAQVSEDSTCASTLQCQESFAQHCTSRGSRNPRPCPPQDDSGDLSLMNAENIGYLLLRHAASKTADLPDLGLIQAGIGHAGGNLGGNGTWNRKGRPIPFGGIAVLTCGDNIVFRVRPVLGDCNHMVLFKRHAATAVGTTVVIPFAHIQPLFQSEGSLRAMLHRRPLGFLQAVFETAMRCLVLWFSDFLVVPTLLFPNFLGVLASVLSAVRFRLFWIPSAPHAGTLTVFCSLLLGGIHGEKFST